VREDVLRPRQDRGQPPDWRMPGIIEQDAFAAFCRLETAGLNHSARLVPSLATAIGSSGRSPRTHCHADGDHPERRRQQSTTELERIASPRGTPSTLK